MKTLFKTWLALSLLGLAAGMASAADFALVDPAHPKIITGVFTDLKGHNDGGIVIALVRSLTVPGWVPVSGGGSLGRALGGPSAALGTSYNFTPELKALASAGISALYPDPAKFANLKEMLGPPASGSTPDLTISLAVHWSYVFTNGLKGKGIVTLFYGPAFTF
jgi:hypothetical protein